MAKHGFIGNFDSDHKTWKLYTEQLIQYFAANNTESASKQCAIFLSVCDPTTYQLIRNILAPVKPTKYSLTELATLVDSTCRYPQPSVIIQRYNLNTRIKQPGETIATYVAELFKISEHCSFGDNLDDMLRDFIVYGINNTALQ